MDKTTLPAMYHELMLAPNITLDHCAICGRNTPLEKHHIVRRGAGELYRSGRKLKKPTLTLCGVGNTLKDADDRYLCHGLAHHNMLHFRWIRPDLNDLKLNTKPLSDIAFCGGHLEYLLLDEPTDYLTALGMDGWKRLPRW